MSAYTNTSGKIIALAVWIYSRLLLIELISLFFLLLALLIDIRSEGDQSDLVLIPLVFMGIVYYLLPKSCKESKDTGKVLFDLSSYASSTVILAIILKYKAWPGYDIPLISAGLTLLASIVVIGLIRFRGVGHTLLTSELIIRTYLFTFIIALLYLLPNSQLVRLGG